MLGCARVSLSELRCRLPGWRWEAVRDGFGWQYMGELEGRVVWVHRYSVLIGFYGDDYTTQWRVSENGNSEELYAWLFSNY